MSHSPAPPDVPGRLTAAAGRPLEGRITVPGDKSISHRALMLAALAVGRTGVEGLLEGEDVLRTAAAMRALGARVERLGPGTWQVDGVGLGGLAEPEDVLDMGNAGTGSRLLMGILAGHDLTAFLTGDASLRRRPMNRVMAPLAQMGATFAARSGGRLPLMVQGASPPMPITYRLPVASAQVKSAVLFAGLSAPGTTTVIEPEPTRDHSERMLRHFGARIAVEDRTDGRHVVLTGQPELVAGDLVVPGDPSSAAFPVVAALLVPGSEVTVARVGTNDLRCGLYTTLREMGADLAFVDPREEGGEPIADLVVRASRLKGVEVPPDRAPAMIDEYPVLAVAAAFAEGTTVMRGLGELKVKESDRLAATARGLVACGVKVEVGDDWLIVHGQERVPGGALVETEMDHRIAMAFLVMGLAAQQPVAIDDDAMIATSFPAFTDLMRGLGADLRRV
ncbi:3-phosphoshikimate 1-carboxyvinyltransferase [Zavarzinia sp. CC-PAN008]|uniref:3-phosphoshikimate 1-carboxyvinyltransferase n=1 Tax=Zavarzinia sp. CC-PAN008 TaxID=3243332 RepID=UPI003F749ABE